MSHVQIGSRITIPSYDTAAKKYLDWAGFSLEKASLETFVLRRDFGPLAYPEPPRPGSLAHVHMIEHELCPYCGEQLDIVIEDGKRRSNPCTNPECPGNSTTIPDDVARCS